MGLLVGGCTTAPPVWMIRDLRREGSDRGGYRLARWGWFGGVGMMALGMYTLVGEAS